MSGAICTLSIDFPRQPTVYPASDSGSVQGAKQALALALDRFRSLAIIEKGCLAGYCLFLNLLGGHFVSPDERVLG